MYRSEVEALRKRVRTLERDLQEERAKSADLQQRLHNVLHPPPPPPPPPLPALHTLTKRAWYAAVPTFVVAVLMALSAALVGMVEDDAMWLTLFVWLALSLLVTIPLGMYFADQPIKARTEYDGTAMVFITWFWLPFCALFPVIGIFLALYRVYFLARGRFGAFTVTENETRTTHYEARQIRNEGYPAASLFACIALAHLLLALMSARL